MSFWQRFGTFATFKYDNILLQPLLPHIWCLKIPALVCGLSMAEPQQSDSFAWNVGGVLNLTQPLIHDCPWPRLQPAFGGAAALHLNGVWAAVPAGCWRRHYRSDFQTRFMWVPFWVKAQVSWGICSLWRMLSQPPDTKPEKIKGCAYVIFCYFCERKLNLCNLHHPLVGGEGQRSELFLLHHFMKEIFFNIRFGWRFNTD